MAGLDSARLRKLADELDAEEAAAKVELAQAETQEERDAIRAEIDELKAKNAELEQRLGHGEPPPPPAPHDTDDDEGEDDETETGPKMRKGRKHGQLYQERPGEPGYVYQGEDEPDLVPIEEDAA